jgi:ketosteroid isomerase-like protein
MDDKKAVMELMERYAKALHEKDAGALAATYADDSVLYEQAPPLQVDAKEIKDPKWYAPWFDTWEGPIDSIPYNPTLKVDGDLAVCYALFNTKGVKKPDTKIDMWSRSTMVFTKQNGDWKILHVHHSVPFAMDGSEKALLNLKPES